MSHLFPEIDDHTTLFPEVASYFGMGQPAATPAPTPAPQTLTNAVMREPTQQEIDAQSGVIREQTWADKVEAAKGKVNEFIQSFPPTKIASDVANALTKYAGDPLENAAIPGIGPEQLAMTVFHGSPHKFDKFLMSKIGTGEGAQAYGHGLYFAENPKVAEEYMRAGMGGVPLKENLDLADPRRIAQELYASRQGDMIGALDDLGGYPKNEVPAIKAELDKLKGIDYKKLLAGANKYTVDLPDEHIAKMLDWDKPLSEQPENVQAAIKGLIPETFDKFDNPALEAARTGWHPRGTPWSPMARDILNDLATVHGLHQTGPEMTQLLKDRGIPGIKYLDQGSRGTGAGTRNFVVFDENLVKILKRE